MGWAKDQEWYEEPFCLAGQSLGGYCTALYAEKHPNKVKALSLLYTVVSGQLSWDAHAPEDLEEWKSTGIKVRESLTKPGTMIRLKWFTMEDRLQYDLLPQAPRLQMPVLMIVGDKDTTTPLEHQKLLYERLSGPKSYA